MFNKFNKILLVAFINIIFCFELPELPWETVSVGIMGDSGNSATFNTDNILYGVDLLTFGMTLEETEETEEISVSASIFMPKIGYKIDKRSKDKLNTYYFGELYMAIPFISISTGDPELDQELENQSEDIVDIIDNLGMKVAYGIEYSFNDQLSLSTDVGFNILFNNIDIEGTDLQARLGNSFTKLSLNFSF